MQHTPSRETMERILQTHYLHYLPEAPTLSQCVSFLNQVPISRQTRDFLITRLVPVPDLDLKHLECQEGPAQGTFERRDFYDIIKGHETCKVLVLYGRRRQGKTMAIPHEAVRARREIFGRQDQVVFFHDGKKEILECHLQTVFTILAYMRIPVFFDEFISHSGDTVPREVKLWLEKRSAIKFGRLSMFLYGSHESEAFSMGITYLTGLGGVGPELHKLPGPPCSLLAAMLHIRQPALNGDAFAAAFLNRIALSGGDLSSHMEGSHPDGIAYLKSVTLARLTLYSGERLTAMNNLMYNAKDEVPWALRHLEVAGIVRRLPDSEQLEFTDPVVVAHQAAIQGKSLPDVEGRVFGTLLRSPAGLLPQLIQCIGFRHLTADEIQAGSVWSGKLCRDAEFDALFGIGQHVIIVSAKRHSSEQSWAGSFTRRIEALNVAFVNGKLPGLMSCMLGQVSKFHFVAASVDSGCTQNPPTTCLFGPSKADQQPHEVAVEIHEVSLHMLLRALPAPKFFAKANQLIEPASPNY